MDAEQARADLHAASERWKTVPRLREELHDAIKAALAAGVPVGEIAAQSGYNREHIRRLRIEAENQP